MLRNVQIIIMMMMSWWLLPISFVSLSSVMMNKNMTRMTMFVIVIVIVSHLIEIFFAGIMEFCYLFGLFLFISPFILLLLLSFLLSL